MRGWLNRAGRTAPKQASTGEVDQWLEQLRRKWSVLPAGLGGRERTDRLLTLSNEELRQRYEVARREATSGDGFAVRGWYHLLYSDILRGKRVLDVGSGFGIDGLTFAREGAQVTFLDIVEDNLAVLRRLSTLFGLDNVEFCHLDRLDSLKALPNNFDVIWCQGSLINAPFEVVRAEAQELLRHLEPNGRWIELAYPKRRWVREGRMPFQKWGDKTDGGAPWIEWYDLDKVLALLEPTRFRVVLQLEFHDADFNWFDLARAV